MASKSALSAALRWSFARVSVILPMVHPPEFWRLQNRLVSSNAQGKVNGGFALSFRVGHDADQREAHLQIKIHWMFASRAKRSHRLDWTCVEVPSEQRCSVRLVAGSSIQSESATSGDLLHQIAHERATESTATEPR